MTRFDFFADAAHTTRICNSGLCGTAFRALHTLLDELLEECARHSVTVPGGGGARQLMIDYVLRCIHPSTVMALFAAYGRDSCVMQKIGLSRQFKNSACPPDGTMNCDAYYEFLEVNSSRYKKALRARQLQQAKEEADWYYADQLHEITAASADVPIVDLFWPGRMAERLRLYRITERLRAYSRRAEDAQEDSAKTDHKMQEIVADEIRFNDHKMAEYPAVAPGIHIPLNHLGVFYRTLLSMGFCLNGVCHFCGRKCEFVYYSDHRGITYNDGYRCSSENRAYIAKRAIGEMRSRNLIQEREITTREQAERLLQIELAVAAPIARTKRKKKEEETERVFGVPEITEEEAARFREEQARKAEEASLNKMREERRLQREKVREARRVAENRGKMRQQRGGALSVVGSRTSAVYSRNRKTNSRRRQCLPQAIDVKESSAVVRNRKESTALYIG
jgi:hypothetical protein